MKKILCFFLGLTALLQSCSHNKSISVDIDKKNNPYYLSSQSWSQAFSEVAELNFWEYFLAHQSTFSKRIELELLENLSFFKTGTINALNTPNATSLVLSDRALYFALPALPQKSEAFVDVISMMGSFEALRDFLSIEEKNRNYDCLDIYLSSFKQLQKNKALYYRNFQELPLRDLVPSEVSMPKVSEELAAKAKQLSLKVFKKSYSSIVPVEFAEGAQKVFRYKMKVKDQELWYLQETKLSCEEYAGYIKAYSKLKKSFCFKAGESSYLAFPESQYKGSLDLNWIASEMRFNEWQSIACQRLSQLHHPFLNKKKTAEVVHTLKWSPHFKTTVEKYIKNEIEMMKKSFQQSQLQ